MEANYNFELKEIDKPVYLHFEFKKFWEISLNTLKLESSMRTGKLLESQYEDTTTFQTLTKTHTDIGDAINYVEKHVNLKLSKGYSHFTKKEKSKEMPLEKLGQNKPGNFYSINIIPAEEKKGGLGSGFNSSGRNGDGYEEEKTSLKRKSPNELIHDQLKKVKQNQDDDALSDLSFYMDVEEEKESKKKPEPNHFQFDSDKSDFKGEYLESADAFNTKFVKIQVYDNFVKVESGLVNGSKPSDTSYTQLTDKKDAINNAQKQIAEKISQGYKRKHEKFFYDFKGSEVNADRNFLVNPPAPTKPSSANNSKNNSRNVSPRNSPPKFNNDDWKKNFNPGDFGDDDATDQLQVFKYDDYSETSRRTSMNDLDDLDTYDFNDNKDDDSNRGRNKDNRGRGADNRDRSRSPSPQPNFRGNNNKDVFLGKPVPKAFGSVLLAKTWEEGGKDPTGMYISEKLDGVRCFWTGTQMFSRNGNRYNPPRWFIQDFPNSPLDGELWCGRSTFQKCVSYIRKQNPIDDEWRKVTYLVFDAPNLHLPFSQRFEALEKFFKDLNSDCIKLHRHEICRGKDHLFRELERVEKLAGEGLMLRVANSLYEQRRSDTLLKVKTFQDDEATVIGYEEGKGRNTGVVGALKVRNKDGIEFKVGSGFSDQERRKPPKIGTVITYKHQGVSDRGVPRFPTFLRVYEPV